MMTRQEQILTHESLTVATAGVGLTFTSKQMPWGGESGWLMVIQNKSAITGTTPGIIWELDVSDNGGAFTRVGAAIATFATLGVLVVPYFTNSTQGVVAAGVAGHTYTMQIKGVLGNADNVAADITVDLIAMN